MAKLKACTALKGDLRESKWKMSDLQKHSSRHRLTNAQQWQAWNAVLETSDVPKVKIKCILRSLYELENEVAILVLQLHVGDVTFVSSTKEIEHVFPVVVLVGIFCRQDM